MICNPCSPYSCGGCDIEAGRQGIFLEPQIHRSGLIRLRSNAQSASVAVREARLAQGFLRVPSSVAEINRRSLGDAGYRSSLCAGQAYSPACASRARNPAPVNISPTRIVPG